ncbi:hypothetical protein EDB87DRAFT_1338580 [Lactarius vividus]|nr:hypothetical protein EDB87DRAFT_1338580 [Lactarius vividus]
MPNDASLPNPNATFDLLRPRSPVPAVASASPSVSPSPFAPPSRSLPPEPENDMTVISVTGPGDDPVPVSRENDGQTDPARKNTDNVVEMRAVTPPDRELESQPPPALAGAARRSTSSQSRVPSRRMSKTPLFLPSPSESTSSEPPTRQRDRDRDHDPLDIISIDSSSSSSRPPPPRRSPRKAKKQRGHGQLMAYVLVPRLPPGARRSDYAPVRQRPRTRQRQTAAKGKARAGDNSGSNELVHMLQVAFENNWPGAGSARPSGKKTKKAAEETVVVVDDEDEEEESDKSKIPTPLDQALAAAFTHNSMNPNVVASASAPAATTTRRSAKETRAKASRVEVVIPLPPKRARTHANAQFVSPRRKEKRHPRTPTSPRRKRRRVEDEQAQDDSDNSEIEIIVDPPRKLQREPKAKPQSHPPAQPQPRHKPRRSAQQHRTSTPPAIHTSMSIHTSTPESTPPPQEQSSPITPPDVNSLAGLPLTILPEPARTEIAIPPRALSYLHSSPDPPDPVCKLQETDQYAIRQGFCYEGAAVGAHGLLATSPAAEPSPVSDSGACAITTNSTLTPVTVTDPDDLQEASLDLDLDLDIPMDLEAGLADADADAHGVGDDVVPPHPPPPLLRTAGTHEHPDGPMLGFVIPEHDGIDHSPSANIDVGRALTSPSQGLSFNLTSPIRAGEGSIDWHAENVFGVAGASTDTGAGEYAGNGTIDPSVLGGGGNLSPGKLGDDPSSPIRAFGGMQPSRATDEDDEEEEDVMGMLFENKSDDDFVPPSGLGKGKGKSRAVVVDGVVELSESVAAAAGSRMRRKTWRKELADEAEIGGNNDSSDESSDDDGPRAHAISAPVFTNARRKKRTPASSTSGVLPGGLTFCHHCRSTTRRPKMRCTLIKASTDKQCRNLFCDRCIEKRYPQLTFDRIVEDFECPACRNFCNCSLCSRKRGEAYIPERDGGWRSWIARQGGSHRAGPTPAKKSKNKNPGKAPATTKKPVMTTTTDAQVFDESWSATAVFTVSGEPLGSAFLQGNKARIVPVSQPTASPAAATTTPTAPTTITASPIPEVAQEEQRLHKRRYAFIGKPRKTWGRLVSLPDPEDNQLEQQKKTKGKGKMAGRGRRGKRIRLFVGNLEPLLVARRRRRRRSASLMPLDDDEDGDEVGNEGGDADADVNADDGIWPGEYVVPVPAAEAEEMARITPEEVERAIGAAFAISGSAQSSSSSSSM